MCLAPSAVRESKVPSLFFVEAASTKSSAIKTPRTLRTRCSVHLSRVENQPRQTFRFNRIKEMLQHTQRHADGLAAGCAEVSGQSG